jgi:23S rRNA m2A2503 methyltransferase
MNNELIKLSEAELTDLLTSWGYPRFRGKQVFEWVHRHHASSFEEMSNLPKELRARLAEAFPLNNVALFDRQASQDGTRKYVIELSDGALVETVGMPVFKNDGTIDRLTVCVSSQVGCPMACSFCATGREGLTRNLEAAEIIAQVALVQNDFDNRVSNIVVMGQGEPFLNYEEVLSALLILNSDQDFNIGARHITISTCGLIAGIDRLAKEPEQFTLAVSLHSAIQHKRDSLMPKVSQQSLPLLKEALRVYIQKTNRRVTLEYLLIEGINDSEKDLQALIEFREGLLCHVNLLPVNAIEGSPLRPASEETADHWVASLSRHGIETSFRRSRGSDIDGACGQLKNKLTQSQPQ